MRVLDWQQLQEGAATIAGAVDARSLQFERAEAALLGEEHGTLKVGPRALSWVTALHAYETFWLQSGRAPRERTRRMETLPDEERRLGEWAGRQRRYRERLDRFRQARLDLSPAFEWDPRQARWDQNLREVETTLRGRGRVPFENSRDAAEAVAAIWWARQMKHLRDGTLSPVRAERIQALLDQAQSDRQLRPVGRKQTSH